MAKTVSTTGVALVKQWEGCKLTAYKDSVGVWTIGYGTTKYPNGTKIKQGDKITQAEADAILKRQIQEHADGMTKYINTDTLTQNQYDALASFHYNLGANILKGSALLTHLKNKEWNKAAATMLQYNKGRINGVLTPIQGLTNRRNAEVALFKKGQTTVKTAGVDKMKLVEIEHHVGHFGKGTGAHSIVDEVVEAKKIMDGVHGILKANGVPSNVYQDTTSKTQAANLNNLVAHHNKDTNALIVSYHLNCSAGVTKNGIGTEVCHKTQTALASKMSAAIAKAGGFINRGAKYRNDLAVLNRTVEPAILLETFFVNSEKDVELYRKNFDAICYAIATVLAEHIGYKIKDTTVKTASHATTTDVKYYKPGDSVGMYRVIKECGEYDGVKFADAKKLNTLKPGVAFTVKEIVKYGDVYRLKTKSKTFVTAKKEHVEKV